MFKEQAISPDWFLRKIEIRKSPIHGMGVFANQQIDKHELFESCPVILFHKTILNDYTCDYGYPHILDSYVFLWDNGNVALALGYGSVYNHSNTEANAQYKINVDDMKIEFVAKRKIEPGEEIRIHYNHGKNELDFSDAGTCFRVT